MNGLGVEGHWIPVRDGDPRAVDLYQRHYSANPKVTGAQRRRHGMSGPGETLTLITVKCDALFIWLKNRVERYDKQTGVNCTVFRNEGEELSSELVKEADAMAWHRWPGERHFTYVEDGKINSVNPGYCFKMAGWRTCGRNKDGRLTILELVPMQ